MLPIRNNPHKSNNKESETHVKFFKEGERVACREYLNKNCKWRFGTVIQRLGKLHYYIKLENGNVWKLHVNQMRTIGVKIVKDQECSVFDCEGPQSNETRLRNRDNVNFKEPNVVAEENIREPTVEGEETGSDSEQNVSRDPEENFSESVSVVPPETQEPSMVNEDRPIREHRVPARLADYVVFK